MSLWQTLFGLHRNRSSTLVANQQQSTTYTHCVWIWQWWRQSNRRRRCRESIRSFEPFIIRSKQHEIEQTFQLFTWLLNFYFITRYYFSLACWLCVCVCVWLSIFWVQKLRIENEKLFEINGFNCNITPYAPICHLKFR